MATHLEAEMAIGRRLFGLLQHGIVGHERVAAEQVCVEPGQRSVHASAFEPRCE